MEGGGIFDGAHLMDYAKEYRKAQKDLRELRRELRENKSAFELANRYKTFAEEEFRELKYIQVKYFELVSDIQALKEENKILIRSLGKITGDDNG